MTNAALQAALETQAKTLIRKIQSGRTGGKDLEKQIVETLLSLYNNAHATGFTDARKNCTLCSIVRVGGNHAESTEADSEDETVT